MKKYLVGGAVRDRLLGLPVKERDWVVVGSTPEQMQALGYKPVGKDFPVFLDPKTGEEHALARTERKSRSEEHTSELQSLMRISYAVFCLKKKNIATPPAYIKTDNAHNYLH